MYYYQAPAVRDASQLTPRSVRGTTSDRRRPPASVLAKNRPETARTSIQPKEVINL